MIITNLFESERISNETSFFDIEKSKSKVYLSKTINENIAKNIFDFDDCDKYDDYDDSDYCNDVCINDSINRKFEVVDEIYNSFEEKLINENTNEYFNNIVIINTVKDKRNNITNTTGITNKINDRIRKNDRSPSKSIERTNKSKLYENAFGHNKNKNQNFRKKDIRRK